MMHSQDFSWIQHPLHHILFKAIPDPMAMRFVGGCVRNTLQGNPPKIQRSPPEDIDLATSYTPGEMITFLKRSKDIKVIPTGIKHGTITAIIGGQPYEITTLRQDIETDGRHATVRYTDSWALDAQRRDFTINALYMDYQGKLYDDVGGYKDLCQKKLCFIGNPVLRIQEDALRIVRFFRFWSAFDYTPDESSFRAVCNMKEKLDHLSGERITQEMLKILQQHNPWSVIEIMEKNGFMPFLFGCTTNTVGRSNLIQLEKEIDFFDPWIRIAHMCTTTPLRLVLSKAQKKCLKHLCSILHWDQARQSAYQYGVFETKKRLILTALHDMNQGKENVLKKLHDTINDIECFSFPPFPLSGNDIKKMGFSGKKIGETLQSCRQWWIDQDSQPSRQECWDYAQCLTRELENDTMIKKESKK
jgi:poly(A) polymerase